MAVTLIILTKSEMGMANRGNDNRCLKDSHNHVVAGAFVFAPPGDVSEPWAVGTQHPAIQSHVTHEWPAWYVEYVKGSFNLDSSWKVQGPPVFQPRLYPKKAAAAEDKPGTTEAKKSLPILPISEWDRLTQGIGTSSSSSSGPQPEQAISMAAFVPKATEAQAQAATVFTPLNKLTFSLGVNKGLAPDWSWVKPKTGTLLHLTAVVKTDVIATLCSLSLPKATQTGAGAKAANSLGRQLCQTCWKRADSRFQELITELWPALAPEIVIE